MTTRTPRRTGPEKNTPKLAATTPEEKEAEHLGRVAGHAHQFAKKETECPHAEDDPLRPFWQQGFDHGATGTIRLDMEPEIARGWRGFHDRLERDECPFGARDGASYHGWQRGWLDAKAAKDKDDDKTYR
jgi:hypothetical protein